MFSLFFITILAFRSCYTYKKPCTSIPTIQTYWQDEPTKKNQLRSSYLDPSTLFFTYDRPYLLAHGLPKTVQTAKEIISTNQLCIDLESALSTIMQSSSHKKLIFDHFDVLKQNDFNRSKHAGNIVLKHHTLPFVIKLFIESPESFVLPLSKGFEPCLFFIMGHGSNRYLCGLSRIKNREEINTIIHASPELSAQYTVPRKWYWEPTKNRFFNICGFFMHDKTSYHVLLPHIYAIICDAIHIERPLSLFNKDDRSHISTIAHALGNRIDPNVSNFVIEKNTHKIAIIDTEHFATMLHLEQPIVFHSYTNWYGMLIKKFITDLFVTPTIAPVNSRSNLPINLRI